LITTGLFYYRQKFKRPDSRKEVETMEEFILAVFGIVGAIITFSVIPLGPLLFTISAVIFTLIACNIYYTKVKKRAETPKKTPEDVINPTEKSYAKEVEEMTKDFTPTEEDKARGRAWTEEIRIRAAEEHKKMIAEDEDHPVKKATAQKRPDPDTKTPKVIVIDMGKVDGMNERLVYLDEDDIGPDPQGDHLEWEQMQFLSDKASHFGGAWF
jgi:hypothetical protein